ncbi:MAG: sigma 54-interacting transcriptional regulator [Bdellovibrionota bacterium]
MRLYTPLIPLPEQKILVEALRLRRSILIEGENGTGKSMLARWLAAHMERYKSMTQIYLDCKELCKNHFEIHFLDKINNQYGALILIDGVEFIPLHHQAKILRIIEQRQLVIISTAPVSLAKRVIKGEFRADLYSRLRGQSILLKALREMPEHLPFILRHVAFSQANIHLDKSALQVLGQYTWPGNLREVANLFDKLHHHATYPHIHDWETLLKQTSLKNQDRDIDFQNLQKLGLRKFLRNLEQSIVQKIYEKNRGHVRKTLHDLKISSGTFYRALGGESGT